jgi:serine/threonine kinase 32
MANDDQNVASDIIPGKRLTSKSGTLAYLAPEVYAGNGYDIRADWWSLGVLFYECIYNKRPFDGNSESSLSQQIQAATPKYPVTQPPVSLSCLYAIGAALNPNRDTRMGATWDSFIYNDFFKVFDFDKLEKKMIEPVFVPSSEKTNFDATYDLEELLLEEAPLEARARRQKPRERLKEDATDKEIREDELYRMIDTDFRPFDYTIAAYKKITADSTTTSSTDEPGQTMGDKTPTSPAGTPQALTTDEATPATPIQQNGALPKLLETTSTNASDHRPGRSGRPEQPSKRNDHPHRPTPVAGRRVSSATGGVQITLDGGGSWSELARQDATLPTDANHAADGKVETSSGMFGFLRSKKGRTNSPRPKERGVLGKEGARVVIG